MTSIHPDAQEQTLTSFEVTVSRIGYFGTKTFEVEAANAEEAKDKAYEEACNESWSEKTSEYEIDSIDPDPDSEPTEPTEGVKAIKEDTYYAWKEVVTDEEGKTCYETPWSDPMLYEHPFDFAFDTPGEAKKMLEDYFDEEQSDESKDWVLCKIYRKLEVLDLEADEPTDPPKEGKPLSLASWLAINDEYMKDFLDETVKSPPNPS